MGDHDVSDVPTDLPTADYKLESIDTGRTLRKPEHCVCGCGRSRPTDGSDHLDHPTSIGRRIASPVRKQDGPALYILAGYTVRLVSHCDTRRTWLTY